MFTFHLLSIISILLLLFTLLQLTSTISTQDDEGIYPKTSSGDNNGGSGTVQVKVDNKVNVHINNSGNGESGGNQIYEPSPRQSSKTAIKPTINKSAGRILSWPKATENVSEETIETKYNTITRKIWLTDSSSLPSSDIDRHLLLTNSRRRRSVIDDHSKTAMKRTTNALLPVHLNGSDSKSSDQSSTEIHSHSRRRVSCSWEGHCDGAPCKTENDCSDDRICIRRRCGSPLRRTEKSCSWKGHCDGASCKNENDCSDDRICIQGRCGSSDQQPNVNTNTNTSTNTNTITDANSILSQINSAGGAGGNGFVIINISGGNGGHGGGSFVIPRQ